jgi:alkylhydroperoxidase family enzyme
VGGELGVPEEKFAALADYRDSDLFDARERTVLEYADGMTITGHEVDDELFGRLVEWFDQDAIVELTAIIAWENASSKFNRALRVPSQHLVESSRSRKGRRDHE